MQAKELQLLDLVFYKGKVFRVVSIDYIGCLVGIDNESDCDLVSEKDIEPIPLTEEILKKNDFIFYNGGTTRTTFYYTKDEKFMLRKIPASFFLYIEHECRTIKIDSVHKLQHALRLCGLNDIADNFII